MGPQRASDPPFKTNSIAHAADWNPSHHPVDCVIRVQRASELPNLNPSCDANPADPRPGPTRERFGYFEPISITNPADLRPGRWIVRLIVLTIPIPIAAPTTSANQS